MTKRLGVIGAGRFGGAFIRGILNSKKFLPQSLWASDRTESIVKEVERLGIESSLDFRDRVSDTEIILLSVKPAQMQEVLEKLKVSNITEKVLIISVAAGTSLSKIERILGMKCPVIRAMPNSPCMVQEGFTAICRGAHATPKHLEIAQDIFQTLGQCLEIDEKFFDLVTALSGSGPAYYYLFMETMIEAGVKAGLDQEICRKLVAQTALGAARMVQKQNRSPGDLKKDVATPGGCTIEALKILEAENFSATFSRAIEEATRVAGALGRG